jgi:nitroreductase
MTGFPASPTVSDAIATRRSIRAFTGQPVDHAVLRTILEKAQRSASGGNVQPWQVSVLTGDALSALIDAVVERQAMGIMGMQPEYPIYPEPLADPWMQRRRDVAAAMYAALGIDRKDADARAAAMRDNFRGFGAPVVLFVHCPRFMGPPQWGDMGMWLTSVCLLLRESGLDSCAQEAWSVYGKTVRDAIGLDDDHIVWTGLAIGHRDADAPVNNFPVDRAPLDEVVRWFGFGL